MPVDNLSYFIYEEVSLLFEITRTVRSDSRAIVRYGAVLFFDFRAKSGPVSLAEFRCQVHGKLS